LFRDEAFQEKPVGFQNLSARGIGLIKRHENPQRSQTNSGDAEHGPGKQPANQRFGYRNRKRADSGDQEATYRKRKYSRTGATIKQLSRKLSISSEYVILSV
jgi:hypothetical protein